MRWEKSNEKMREKVGRDGPGTLQARQILRSDFSHGAVACEITTSEHFTGNHLGIGKILYKTFVLIV
jgi:hypothetical protein